MHFITIAGKNLSRRPLRTFFTLLGIATAVGAFISLVGLSRGLENAWMHALLERDTHIFASPKGVVDIMTASIDQDFEEKMAAIPGVKDVSGELVDLVVLNTGQMTIVAGWPVHSYLWQSVNLEQGVLPGKTMVNGVILGVNAAITLGYRVGDSFRIRDRDFVVSGISKPGGAMRNQAMLLTLPALQELNNRHGKVSTLNFRLNRPDDKESLAHVLATLAELFPAFTFTETHSLADNNQILEIFRAMAWGTSTIAIFIGLVVVTNTLLMSVMERTREIGLLSAVGWQPVRILAMILVEGLLLSVFGGLAGTVLGSVGINMLAASPQIRGLIQPAIDGRMFVEVAVATLLLAVLGSGYPAWRAIRFRPADALRYE
jgi:putative ABC transport system permease protein